MSKVEKLLKDIEEIANDTPENVDKASLNEAIDEMRDKANFARLLIESEQVVVVDGERLDNFKRWVNSSMPPEACDYCPAFAECSDNTLTCLAMMQAYLRGDDGEFRQNGGINGEMEG